MILGATSLDEAMAGIEGLSRATALNERLGDEAEQRARRLERLRADLAVRGARASTARATRPAPVPSGSPRPSQGSARRSPALRRRQSLTAQRLATLQARARAAEQRSEDITQAAAAERRGAGAGDDRRSARPRPRPPPPPPATGTRTFVADAVAYHLPGKTASGLPVGVGVIAVDPTVIPLGTRVFIPGYGPAVAADVGTRDQGEHHRPLDAEHGTGARLGTAYRHDHDLRLSR